MDLHIILTSKTLVTGGAGKGLDLEMYGSGVPIQTTLLTKLKTALETRKGPCLLMGTRYMAIVA